MLELTHAQAKRAIYVDFECLKTAPPHPALLGVLVDGSSDDVDQLIVDGRLAPARVAKRERTAVVDATAAVDAIVSLARSDDRRIVGWSFFDRDRMIEIRPDLKRDIAALYANALQIARPWRNAVHPSFTIERADQHSAKHTLDKYARLAGYPRAHDLVNATPARWIRHTLDQLEATGGSYRRTTPETKRDWHRLLDYNRDDLLAVRHIAVKATHELEAWRAYEKTRFCADDGARRICFKAGSRNDRLEALLKRKSVTRWAFITASNPHSKPLPLEVNARRHADLLQAVADLELEALPGEGIGEDPAWTPEQSLLVLGISRGKAERLGRRFGQLAIVVGRLGEPSRLVSTGQLTK
jgi:hypothetical protein